MESNKGPMEGIQITNCYMPNSNFVTSVSSLLDLVLNETQYSYDTCTCMCRCRRRHSNTVRLNRQLLLEIANHYESREGLFEELQPLLFYENLIQLEC